MKKQKKSFWSERLRMVAILILLLSVLVQPGILIFNNSQKFFSQSYDKRYEDLQSAYGNSQYAKKNSDFIPDETFEAFAGGFFLKGNNPILIVHDHPPLGRYIVSLSILAFNNEHVIILFLLGFAIFGLFLIGRKVFGNALTALIPISFFVNEPLFLNKIRTSPLPEPIQLPFIIFAVYFFIKAITEKNDKKWFILTALMIGFVISTRFFPLGVVLTASFGAILVFKKELRKKIMKFLIFLPISIIVLILSYTRTIIDSGSVFQIFSIQKYILAYHQSKFTEMFSFWDLLLFNRWHTWWGNRAVLSDPHWKFLWPVSTILTGIVGIFALLKKIEVTLPALVVLSWILFYSAMLSLGYTSTRYFLFLLPFLYIMAVLAVISIYKLLKK